jgi:glycerol-3-phosphate dehydrogenase
MLLEKGRYTLPQLNVDKSNVVGSYAGIRPATQYNDYIIEVDSHSQWCTVAGIRYHKSTSSLSTHSH